MSLSTSKRILKIIKFSRFYDNLIPLVKVKVNFLNRLKTGLFSA